MEVTAAELALLLPTLDKIQFSILLRTILKRKPKDVAEKFETLDVLRAAVWEFLHAIGFVTDGQAKAVLSKLTVPLGDATILFDKSPHTDLTPFRIVIVERRWVSWNTRTSWYDMVFDEDAEALPEPAVLTVVCDVTALYVRLKRWLPKIRSGKDVTGH